MMHVWWNSPSSGNDRLVLLAIADEADDEGRNAYPSIRRLADKVNCHTATVLRSVVRLERSGEVEVVRPPVKAPGRVNKYRVLILDIPTPSEIRARYGDGAVDKTARKVQPLVSTTARIESPNRAHSDKAPRAPMRANPYTDPSTNPRENVTRLTNQDQGCGECDNGWVLDANMVADECQCRKPERRVK